MQSSVRLEKSRQSRLGSETTIAVSATLRRSTNSQRLLALVTNLAWRIFACEKPRDALYGVKASTWSMIERPPLAMPSACQSSARAGLLTSFCERRDTSTCQSKDGPFRATQETAPCANEDDLWPGRRTAKSQTGFSWSPAASPTLYQRIDHAFISGRPPHSEAQVGSS